MSYTVYIIRKQCGDGMKYFLNKRALVDNDVYAKQFASVGAAKRFIESCGFEISQCEIIEFHENG